VLTQLPLQLLCPIGHAPRTHAPAEHTKPTPHALPQLPQLLASLCVLTQLVPHVVRPLMHAHALLTQDEPAAQVRMHAPQLPLLVRVSTHVPPQLVCPAGHRHEPAVQVDPPVHARPHIPQCVLLVLVSTQLPLHRVWPIAQVVAQAPVTHDCPALHIRPHPPQFVALVRVSTHVPPQLLCPIGQTSDESVALSALASLLMDESAPASIVEGGIAAIHARTHASSSSVNAGAPIGMRAPHDGVASAIFT